MAGVKKIYDESKSGDLIMGVPKKKTTRLRKGNRRSHHRATSMTYAKCDNCGELKLAHRVCGDCGHYNNEKVVEKEEL